MSRKSKSKSFNSNQSELKISDDVQENNCVVCFKGVDTYSIGQCDHPVCFECSTRMRVLCKQNECPICRQEMPLVYFTKIVRPFKRLVSSNILSDKKYKIEFENEAVRNAYMKLLEHSCPKCTDKTFNAFHQLQEHVRRVHQLNYCDLCVENLKIFTFERRVYTRHELVSHRRAGDADDKSHKGHPICEFCDIRYMDSDELFRHLRKDHLYCHFCDADGFHQYYNSYSGLRDHFSQEHYLCEEGECTDEQFTSAFRTEIDLKAHKTTVHGKMMGKVGLKQARTLELEFTLAPRQRSRRNHNNWEEEEAGALPVEDLEPVYHHQAGINTDCIAEFPCLGGTSGQSQTSNNTTSSTSRLIGGKQPFRNRHNFSVNDENFPVLGNPVPTSSVPNVNVTVSNIFPPQRSGKTTAGVSIQVRSGKQPQVRKEDFPALSQSSHFPALSQQNNFPSLSCNTSNASTHNPQWSEQKPKPKPVAQPQPKPPPKPTFNMDTSQFPSLGPGDSSTAPSKKSKKKNKSTSQQQPPASLQLSPQKSSKAEPSEPKPAKSEKSKKKQKDPDKQEKSDPKTSKKTENNKQNNKKQDNKKAEIKKDKSKKLETSSENKINSIAETNNNVVENGDNSVSLITEELVKLPPPGFGTGPPPGFGRVKPPPGLTPPGLPPPGFSYQHTYLMPRNFAVRNKKLITEVITSVGEDYFEHFKKFSGMFRNDVISAQDYVEHCSGMMGQVAFDSLFPELLALLPDIEKQQELWSAMDKSTKRSLEMCETCRQVLFIADMTDHLQQHAANLDNQNFPPLPSLLPLS